MGKNETDTSSMNMPAIIGKCGINVKLMMYSVFLCPFCLNIGTFNTVYFREFYSPFQAVSSKSNPRFSVQCCLVAAAAASPSVIALPLQYTRMHNLSRRLRFCLSFGNVQNLHSYSFKPWRGWGGGRARPCRLTERKKAKHRASEARKMIKYTRY